MILFWLYHRLLFANEVKLIHSNRRRVAKNKKNKKLNRINSDKVHECSFKNKVGRTNTFIRSPFTQSHARAGTHTMFQLTCWKQHQSSLCVCVSSHTTHTHNTTSQWESSDSEQRAAGRSRKSSAQWWNPSLRSQNDPKLSMVPASLMLI